MKFLSNLHTHTIYSDGKNTPEECIKKALEKNFLSIGFSDHAPIHLEENLPVEDRYTMDRNNLIKYIDEINTLKEKYKDSIEIYLGIEEDYLPSLDKKLFDYTIGAFHNFTNDETGDIFPVDHTEERFEKILNIKGGKEKFVESYYKEKLSKILYFKPDIVAHLDLITKFNGNSKFFDTNEEWYKDITKKVIEELSKYNFIIEVNTGAISRGYTKYPYPSEDILYEIKKYNIPITISSDCHKAEDIDYWFDEAVLYLKDIGFEKVKSLYGNKFVDIVL